MGSPSKYIMTLPDVIFFNDSKQFYVFIAMQQPLHLISFVVIIALSVVTLAFLCRGSFLKTHNIFTFRFYYSICYNLNNLDCLVLAKQN